MASQLKMEALRDKTPDATISARQEAYAHSAGLLVMRRIGRPQRTMAQGQNMVLGYWCSCSGTVNNFNSAIDTIKTLKRTTQIMITKNQRIYRLAILIVVMRVGT